MDVSVSYIQNLTVKVFMGKSAGSQVCGQNEYLLYLSRLHLAAVHEQGKWVNLFQCALELREG